MVGDTMQRRLDGLGGETEARGSSVDLREVL